MNGALALARLFRWNERKKPGSGQTLPSGARQNITPDNR